MTELNHLKGNETDTYVKFFYNTVVTGPHQWLSGSVLQTGRREVPGSITDRACRPSCSEFSEIFSEILVNTGWHPLGRSPTVGFPP